MSIEKNIAPKLCQGVVIGDRYTVGRFIEEDGFDLNYKGSDKTLKRLVTITEHFQDGSERKGDMIVPPLNMTKMDYYRAVKRYKTGAEILAKINCENVVTIHDYVEENNTGYIITEYVDGETLEEQIARKGKIDTESVIRIVEEVIKGLKEIHFMNVLHRLIVPKNILLANKKIKIKNFGAAIEYVEGKEMAAVQIVMINYSAPEQFSGTFKFGPALDIYSLGATMYRMITGVVAPSAIDRIRTSENDLFKQNMITEELKSIIEKCMRLDSNERYQTLEELENDLVKIR